MRLGKAIPRMRSKLPGLKTRAASFAQRKSDLKGKKVLGEGAFGKAFSGTMKPYGKVVVKTASGTKGMISINAAIGNMAYEVQVLSRIQDFPFVPRLLEVGRDYFVMEDVQGVSMLDLLAKKGMSAQGILSVVVSTAIIAHKLHEDGIAHGDLEARNILLTPNGVVVIDFGLAVIRGKTNPLTKMTFKETMTKDIANVLEDMLLASESVTTQESTQIAIASIFEKYRKLTISGRITPETGRKVAEDLLFILSQEGAVAKRGGKVKHDRVKVRVI